MNFDGEELSPESRRRMADRSHKWRRASYVRALWTDEDFRLEAERLQAAIENFPVTRAPTPSWASDAYKQDLRDYVPSRARHAA